MPIQAARQVLEKQSVVFALACYTLFIGILWLDFSLAPPHGLGMQDTSTLEFYSSRLPFQAVAASLVAGIVMLAGWQRRTWMAGPLAGSGSVWLVPSVVIAALILGGALIAASPDFRPSLTIMVKAGLFFLLVGVFEELLFRGLLMGALLQRVGPVFALMLSSVLFGVTHLINYWIEARPLDATLLQVAHASASGILYGALVLRTGSIWSAVALHAFWDFSLAISAEALGPLRTPSVSASPDGLVVSFFIAFDLIIGLLVLRSWRRQKRAPA